MSNNSNGLSPSNSLVLTSNIELPLTTKLEENNNYVNHFDSI